MSWLTGWTYRKAITIDSSTIDSDLTDFQVKVDLTSANFDFSKANSDGSDIRFCNSNGDTIYFWTESWDSSGETATLWVKVPSVSSSTDTIFYMYYGNSGASSASDIVNTAKNNLGDDFDEASIDTSKWTAEKKGSSSAIVELDGSGNLHLAGEHNVVSSANLKSVDTFTNGFSLRVKRKWTSEHYEDMSIGNGVLQSEDGGQSSWWGTMQGDGYLTLQQNIQAHFMYRTPSGASCIELDGDNATAYGATDTWEIEEMIYDASGALKWMHNDVEKWSATDTTYLSSNKYITLSQGEYSLEGYGGDSYYDWVFVRQYIDPEPTYTIGSEETRGVTYNSVFFGINF